MKVVIEKVLNGYILVITKQSQVNGKVESEAKVFSTKQELLKELQDKIV